MNKTIILAFIGFVFGIGFMVYNESGTKEVVISDPYVYSFSRCAQWNTGAKGVSHCGKYVPAQETRVNIRKEGKFFTVESYRVVN